MPTIKAALSDAKDQVERLVRGEKKPEPGASGYLQWLSHQVQVLSASNRTTQVTVGAVTGWASGFVFGRFGRTAATAVAGSVLALHVGQQLGYITIDWKRVNRDVNAASKELEKKARNEGPEVVRRVKELVVENAVIATGFGAGFVLGLASS